MNKESQHGGKERGRSMGENTVTVKYIYVYEMYICLFRNETHYYVQ